MDLKTTSNLPILTASDLWLVDWDRAACYFAERGRQRAQRNPTDEPETTTAVIAVAGPLAKDPWVEMWGGTSTMMAQARVRQARADESVDSIYLLVDSPGGEVAGTEELALEIAATRGVKPIHAHIDDLGASAALWVATQADSVSANATADVGSIGTVAAVADFSEFFAKEGIKVHVISSGENKGAFVPGSEVTEDQLGMLQKRVDALASQFKESILAGRPSMDPEALDGIADGRILSAQDALEVGLIDSIGTRQEAFTGLRRGTEQRAENLARVRASVEHWERVRGK